MISFPTDFASSTLSTMSTVVNYFGTPLTLLIGVGLGLLSVVILIRALFSSHR